MLGRRILDLSFVRLLQDQVESHVPAAPEGPRAGSDDQLADYQSQPQHHIGAFGSGHCYGAQAGTNWLWCSAGAGITNEGAARVTDHSKHYHSAAQNMF